MRYYIIPSFYESHKSHLAYLSDGFHQDAVCQVCLPNIPIWAKHQPCGNGTFEATEETLKDWDKYGHEVTCPTCLERARTGVRLPAP